jgi:hypothetical protein
MLFPSKNSVAVLLDEASLNKVRTKLPEYLACGSYIIHLSVLNIVDILIVFLSVLASFRRIFHMPLEVLTLTPWSL